MPSKQQEKKISRERLPPVALGEKKKFINQMKSLSEKSNFLM
jgi:hypothetical protein